MFKSGKFVAEHISSRDGNELRDNQIQPNGVDLTVQEVYKPEGIGIINDDSKTLPKRKTVESRRANNLTLNPETRDDPNKFEPNSQYYTLYPRSYIVEYGEEIHIPDGHVGLVLPRSTVMRSNGMVNTALWDSGYKGVGEGKLQIDNKLYLQRYSRIAQIVFAEAESFGKYDGQYQGENL